MKQLSDLLNDIYEAALDPDLWPSTLQAMATAFGACFAGFGWEDTRVMAIGGSYGSEPRSEDEKESYTRRYKTLIYSNPMRVPVLLTRNVDDVFTPEMLVPPDEYRASRYYREYVQPMGWGDGLSVILSKAEGVVHYLAFARAADAPPYGPADIELLKLLAPHIRRAYTIGNLIGRQRKRIEGLAQTFDGLAAAVFVLDDRGRVTYRNDSGAALLAQGKPLIIVNERLCHVTGSLRGHGDRAFERALRAAVHGTFDATQGSMVLEGTDESRHLVHFLPLAARDRARTDDMSTASVSIFVTRVGFEAESPIKTIARTFSLTPREASILVALMEVGSLQEVAERHGVSLNTVRSQMKAIFTKTGVGRQADVVKLVASYLGPTRAPEAARPGIEARVTPRDV